MTTIAWFDDLAVGMQFKSGEAQITAAEIKRFAAEFDPQPMHLDEEAAGKTFFKGLAASGWHTASIAMRLLVESRPFGDPSDHRDWRWGALAGPSASWRCPASGR
jgi:acyl dehydratase